MRNRIPNIYIREASLDQLDAVRKQVMGPVEKGRDQEGHHFDWEIIIECLAVKFQINLSSKRYRSVESKTVS